MRSWPSAAVAGTVAFGDGELHSRSSLTGYQEDPLVLSTSGSGDFQAELGAKDQKITYQLQLLRSRGRRDSGAHPPRWRRRAAGSSCSSAPNLGNGPAGTQACPAAPATITGTITPAESIGPAGQGIAAGEFGELTAAIRGGVTYANVHSTKYPGGEIRAQLRPAQGLTRGPTVLPTGTAGPAMSFAAPGGLVWKGERGENEDVAGGEAPYDRPRGRVPAVVAGRCRGHRRELRGRALRLGGLVLRR